MREAETISRSLTTLHSGKPWHGPSFKLILADITPAMAATRIKGAHSIWELLEHMRGWIDVVILRLDGHAIDEPPDGDFPTPPKPTAATWSAAIQRYERSQRQLQARLKMMTTRDWNRKLPGRPYPASVMLSGILNHNLYHAGQIAVLKRLLQARQS